ncbi:hypothetical protein HID58_020521, partial [Brassica napus]
QIMINVVMMILLCLISLLCFFTFFKKPKDSSDLPPRPPSMPIIGHLHLLLSSLIHKSFQKISSNYGPLLHLRIFNVPIVLVSSASVANEIFKSHDVNISSRGLPPIDESLFFGSSGFFSAPHGDYWKFMKKLVVAKLLGPQAIERSRTIRAEELERFYFDLLEKAMKKETVEIRREAMKFTNNSTCKMIIGRRCWEENGEGERVRGLITESIALTKKVLFATLLRKPLEKLGIPLFKKEIMDISGRYNEVLESFLVEHETKLEKHHLHQSKDLMDVLLEAKEDENAEYKITRDHIKSLFVELFLGGTDTSKQTIQWTMARIINNPKVIERLREEMDSVVGKSRLIQETDLPNLPYLQAVIKEALRMYPPVPLFGRRLQEGCKMGGFYVAEKTTLVVNGYAIMRDPNYWEDPDEFKPERFLGEQGDEIREQVLKYLSFGSGRRGCPGSNLAYIFLGTAIGMMIQCFDWRTEEVKVNLEETLSGMVLTMAHPLKCIPVPRICSFPKPKDGFELPPSPPSLPIIGHLHLLLSGSTHKALQKLSSRYGPLFHLNIFSVPVIFVSSASVAYEIFREHDVNFSFRGTPPIDESLLVGSFGFFTAPYGDYWKFMKKIMVTKLLGPQALERSRGIRDYEGERLYASLLDNAVKNESVEIGKEAMKFTNNIICKMIMGRSCNEENGEAERVRDLVAESTALTMKIFVANMFQRPLKKLRISLFREEIMRVSRRFDEVLERILEEHEKKKDDDQDMDLVDVLLETCRDETTAEYRITRNHIKSLFVDLVISGSDTSRHATQWTMAEIISNPKVLERLREEIGSVVGETRLVQETDLENLPYLQATVKEGLRLHPPGALFARSSREGCKIRGFYVPENTPLVVNAYAVMRDPDSWENPNEFKPERFIGFPCSRQQDERDHALKYIPFGSGRRGCPGSNLAYIIVGTAIGVMVQCFDWKIKADEVDMDEAPRALVLTMARPLKCIPVARTCRFQVPDLEMSLNSQAYCSMLAEEHWCSECANYTMASLNERM